MLIALCQYNGYLLFIAVQFLKGAKLKRKIRKGHVASLSPFEYTLSQYVTTDNMPNR